MEFISEGPMIFDGNSIVNVPHIKPIDPNQLSNIDFKLFMLHIRMGIVTITDLSVRHFVEQCTIRKVDIFYSDYTKLWTGASLIYNLPVNMGGDPFPGPYLCVRVKDPHWGFPESSRLYFSATLTMLTESSGNMASALIQRGKTPEEFKFSGVYDHHKTKTFCYNCSTAPASEKEQCEKLIATFAKLNFHILVLHLNSKYNRDAITLPSMRFHAEQLIDSYYNDKDQNIIDTITNLSIRIFLSKRELHFPINLFKQMLIQPNDSVYTSIHFVLYTLDRNNLDNIFMEWNCVYANPTFENYLWMIRSADDRLSFALSESEERESALRGDITIRHINNRGQIKHLKIISTDAILQSCFTNVKIVLYQSSISVLLSYDGNLDSVISCLLDHSGTFPFASLENIDHLPAVYVNNTLQLYTLLYFFPEGSNINRDMHLIGVFFIQIPVSFLSGEIVLKCSRNWIGYAKYGWSMSCLKQLRLARKYVMSNSLEVIVRVHDDYFIEDSFAYDELLSLKSFSYVLMFMCATCTSALLMYYCIALCKDYKRLLE